MDAETVLALVILAALVVYALSGGADYGGGMWDLLAVGPRAQRQRAAIEHAIGPIWEANHVWLILVLVVLFSAFPAAFAALMTALHVPMTLVVLGIVARGSAFVFRKYDVQADAVHRRWSAIFGVASFLTPFFLGLALGGLASGEIRVVDGRVTSGWLAGWTSGFALAVGFYAQGLFAFLAATYLTVDTESEPDLQDDFRRRALAAGVGLAPVALLVFVLSRRGAPEIFEALTGAPGLLLFLGTSVCALGALAALWRRRYRWARAAAAGQVTLILLGWGIGQYPHVIVPDVTFESAKTAAPTLRLLVWTLGGGTLVLLPAFAYLFRVFKARGRGA